MENPARPNELPQNYTEDYKEQQELEHQLQLLEQRIRKVLSKDALQRYGNIKAANPQFAVHILLALSQYIEKTGLRSIDDKNFKLLLKQMVPNRKNINIKRK